MQTVLCCEHLGGVDTDLVAREDPVGVGVDERERGAEEIRQLVLEPHLGPVVEQLQHPYCVLLRLIAPHLGPVF